MSTNILFIIFSFFLLFCALLMVVSKHPVFSLLFLVGCFVFSALLLFLLECEFLALLFIVIYVGAIAVLFLFASMMLETKFVDLSKNLMKYMPVGFLFFTLLFLPMLSLISDQFALNILGDSFYFNKYRNWYDLIDSVSDIEVYGQVLYSYFVLHFLIAGLILLMVLVGVVYLTNNANKNKILEQSGFKQLSRNSNFLKNIKND